MLLPDFTKDSVTTYLEAKEELYGYGLFISHVLDKINSFQGDGRILVLEGNEISKPFDDFTGKKLHYQTKECKDALSEIESLTLEEILQRIEPNCLDIGKVVSNRMDAFLDEIKEYTTYLNDKIKYSTSRLLRSKLNDRIILFNKKAGEIFIVLFHGKVYKSAEQVEDWTTIEFKDLAMEFKQNHKEFFNILTTKTNHEEFKMNGGQMTEETCVYILNQLKSQRNKFVLHTGFIFSTKCEVTDDEHVVVRYNWKLELNELNEILSKAENLITSDEQKETLKKEFKVHRMQNLEFFYYVSGSNTPLFESIDFYREGMTFKRVNLKDWISNPYSFPEKVAYEFMNQFKKTNQFSISKEFAKITSEKVMEKVVKTLFESIKMTPTSENFLNDLPVEFNNDKFDYECKGSNLENFSCVFLTKT